MMAQVTHRIFFALWLDEAVREQIKQTITPYLQQSPAQRVPFHNWHITLAFLGNVSEQTYGCALRQAGQVVGQGFELTLNEFGYWPRPRVVWLGCSTIPTALNNLVANLNQQLQPCDYTPEHARYVPHLTVLRKAKQGLAETRFDSVVWNVRDFVLVASEQTRQGHVYKIIQRWPLHTDA